VSGPAPELRPDTPADRRRRERMLRALPVVNPAVRQAMAALPRHAFVPADVADRAYEDAALPIWAGQTISQPRVVAHMLDLLELSPGLRVLDIGAGCGYAAALIGRLVAPGAVVAVERIADLAARAAAACAVHAPGVRVVHGDGIAGEGVVGTFDRIHAACQIDAVPSVLLDRVGPGGVVVAPVGPAAGVQRLRRLRRGPGGWMVEDGLDVLFVPGLPGTA
jgi:protein-L-isoaspartate(D-aspartate) O-methyltransferase